MTILSTDKHMLPVLCTSYLHNYVTHMEYKSCTVLIECVDYYKVLTKVIVKQIMTVEIFECNAK
jgi:hypothetical protein